MNGNTFKACDILIKRALKGQVLKGESGFEGRETGFFPGNRTGDHFIDLSLDEGLGMICLEVQECTAKEDQDETHKDSHAEKANFDQLSHPFLPSHLLYSVVRYHSYPNKDNSVIGRRTADIRPGKGIFA